MEPGQPGTGKEPGAPEAWQQVRDSRVTEWREIVRPRVEFPETRRLVPFGAPSPLGSGAMEIDSRVPLPRDSEKAQTGPPLRIPDYARVDSGPLPRAGE